MGHGGAVCPAAAQGEQDAMYFACRGHFPSNPAVLATLTICSTRS
jgi:hypothetical protein